MRLTALDDAAWASPWRRKSVGAKLALSLGLVLTALIAPAPLGCELVAAVAIVLIVASARIKPVVLWQAMAAPLVFLLLGAVSVALSIGGGSDDAWWRLGPVAVTPTSVGRALSLLAHGIAGTLAVMVLALTTPMVDVLTWLRRMRIPDPLLEVASLTYRLLFVLLDTALGVVEAQRNRLGDAAGLRRRVHNAGTAVGAVALRSWERANRLTEGLAIRGFEDSLVTLAPRRDADRGFVVLTAGTLALVWLVLVGVCLA